MTPANPFSAYRRTRPARRPGAVAGAFVLCGSILSGLISSLISSNATAASPSTDAGSELTAYLHQSYYAVEFFVFERPGVLDHATEEILNQHRPRALPRSIRTQRLDPQSLWTDPIDPLTRACLTFPLLTYELLDPLPTEDDFTDQLDETPESLETAAATSAIGEPLPVPEITPVLAADPKLEFLAAMAEYERSLEADSQRWQPEEAFELQREAARVERRGLGRILFHGRWLQAVPPRERPDPVLVTGGELLRYPTEVRELVGSVGVTLGRYLHFNAELFFHAPGLGQSLVSVALDPTGLPIIATRPSTPPGYMVISESRRMRSGELHYLDHPKLGLVVRIDPIPIPEALIQAFEALEENAE